MAERIRRPGDVLCGGTYGEKYRQRPELRGQPCERWTDPAVGFCPMHKPIPEARRCKGKGRTHLAMKGQVLCGIHGGKNPRNLAAASRRMAEAKLEKQVTRLLAAHGVSTPVENPLKELQELAGQAKAYKDTLANIVGDLTEIRYEDAKGAEQLRSEVSLLERAIDRLGKFLVQMAQLDIDARLVRIAEIEAAIVIAAINAALADAGVTGAAATRAREIAATYLETNRRS